MPIFKNRYFAMVLLLMALVTWYFVYTTQWVIQELEKPNLAKNAEILGENISVDLTINDKEKMVVSVAAGSDNCQVLKKALEQGQLNSLDMKYSDQYQTFSVYKINGLGKDDSPWWTYEVNGKEPPAGCSQVKVNKGDKIEWKYLGK